MDDNQALRQAHHMWRASQANLDAVAQAAEADLDLAGWMIWRELVNRRRFIRRWFRSQYGIILIPGRTRALRRAPHLMADKSVATFNLMWLLSIHADCECAAALESIHVTGSYAGVPAAWLRIRRTLPMAMNAVAMEKAPSRYMRPQAAYSLAGWTATQLSLGKNQRLRRALANAGGGTLFDALLRELPAAVTVAWGDGCEPEQTPQTFVNAVARSIERGGLLQDDTRKHATLDPAFDAPDNTTAAELAELAAWSVFETLSRDAQLTTNEHDVLQLAIMDWTEQQIADHLGTSVGAVKSWKSRARGKIRRVA